MKKLILTVVMVVSVFGQDITKEMKYNQIELINKGNNIALYYGETGSTGRPATNYVKPHYRSNGQYINGYWRS